MLGALSVIHHVNELCYQMCVNLDKNENSIVCGNQNTLNVHGERQVVQTADVRQPGY